MFFVFDSSKPIIIGEYFKINTSKDKEIHIISSVFKKYESKGYLSQPIKLEKGAL
jgi:hypothetical protein